MRRKWGFRITIRRLVLLMHGRLKSVGNEALRSIIILNRRPVAL